MLYEAVNDKLKKISSPKLRSKYIESLLPAQPFRYGEVKKMLDDDDLYRTLYDVVETETVRIEELDTRFIKKAKGAVKDGEDGKAGKGKTDGSGSEVEGRKGGAARDVGPERAIGTGAGLRSG